MNVKTERKKSNTSQLRLAVESGVSRYRIYLAEQGFIKLNLGEMAKIRKVLNKFSEVEGGQNESKI